MNKIILFTAISLLTLSSCRKEDENVPVKLTEIPVSIIGIWNLSNNTIISGKTGATLLSQNADACDKKSTINFQQNGNATSHIFAKLGTICTDFGTEDAPYTYNSSTKTLTYDGEMLKVITLKDNQLTYEDPDFDTDTDGDGTKDKQYVTFVR